MAKGIFSEYFPSGRRAEFWKQNANSVKQAVNSMKLAALPENQLQVHLAPTAQAKFKMAIPHQTSGIIAPHLHLDGNLYPVTDAQWAAFSKRVVKDITGRLGSAKTVSVEGLVNLSKVSAENF